MRGSRGGRASGTTTKASIDFVLQCRDLGIQLRERGIILGAHRLVGSGRRLRGEGLTGRNQLVEDVRKSAARLCSPSLFGDGRGHGSHAAWIPTTGHDALLKCPDLVLRGSQASFQFRSLAGVGCGAKLRGDGIPCAHQLAQFALQQRYHAASAR